MNIVKGVADLLRRSSGSSSGEGGSWTHADKLAPPSPRIRFLDIGEEAVLNALWQRYENAIDKTEKRKLLQVFLLHFIQTYRNWEPVNSGPLYLEQTSGPDDIIIGCSAGHPSEVILILIQEIARITSLVSELNNAATQANPNQSEPSLSLSFGTEGLYVLNCLIIITRSSHNCRVFSYYGGVQKVAALLKAAVVQLKALTSAFAVDEQLTSSSVEKARVLQKILVYVVSIISSFMELSLIIHKSAEHVDTIEGSVVRDNLPEVPLSSLKPPHSEERSHWQQKAIVMVMEAGGVNWLVGKVFGENNKILTMVQPDPSRIYDKILILFEFFPSELLRVIRRLNLREQGTDLSLHHLTLGALRSALSGNSRAQNHFRSIGGLEVLLDGLGLPSSKFSVSNNTFLSGNERFGHNIYGIFQLQILSLEVLREATFGNLNNMQFLCENGRIHKLANSMCWPAYMLQVLRQQRLSSSVLDSQALNLNSVKESLEKMFPSNSPVLDQTESSSLIEWTEYSVKLSRALCSFLLAPEDIGFHDGKESVGLSSIPVSLAYWELSIIWVMKVLLTVFPCLKACSAENELPNHIRVLANTLQHYILCAFRKVLGAAPALLEVFRDEGIWTLIFSEKFFYFGPSLQEFTMEIGSSADLICVNSEVSNSFGSSKDQSKPADVDILQVEAISFLEFAATISGNTNNLPECSVLLDALEQSAYNPGIASILLRSLLRILQLALEQTLASFNLLDAIARVLKVACIQSQEARKLDNLHNHSDDVCHGEEKVELGEAVLICSVEHVKDWTNCFESALELFSEYVSAADNAKTLVLHNDSCVDYLFDLFWERSLQKRVLDHILGLFKLPASSSEDHRAKLHLCSKYLETFTRAKEKETCFAELSIDLLISMREMILIDRPYYQALFRDGECFLHIVSLLNGTLDKNIGEKLVLNVLQTLTLLLTGNDDSKVAFRLLVGVGYQTLQSLLMDFCKWQPSKGLLNALLDMLVDGKYDMQENAAIKNEDVIVLFFNVLHKQSSSVLQHYGLDVFLNLLKDSIINRTSCFRAGMLEFLLDWFSKEETDDLIAKLAKLIEIVGGHSISGKDIRKIFALLRNEKFGSTQKYSLLLLSSVRSMLKEKGPEAFFELNGSDSNSEGMPWLNRKAAAWQPVCHEFKLQKSLFASPEMRRLHTTCPFKTLHWQVNIGSIVPEMNQMRQFNFHDAATVVFITNTVYEGIKLKSPLQWPNNKGFSFSCWIRIEDFLDIGMMGLFCFLTDNGRGCLATLGEEKLVFESINQKRQRVSLSLKLSPKKWHFLCVTHSIGRAFSGGSLVRCYVDGDLVSSERCRYVKVGELMTRCTIGTELMPSDEESRLQNIDKTSSFHGQIGPVYMFGDALSSEQIKAIHCLGPSYMYSFLGDEVLLSSDNSMYGGILDAKDGLSSKIIFGLSAQANDGRTLFNVSPMPDNSSDKTSFHAVVMDGTKLCSRRLLQEILYCVGGVSVFFPLLTQFEQSERDNEQHDYALIKSIMQDRLASEVIELIASVLDGNISNQKQMHLLSGFSILGFLLQSVPSEQLNMATLSALKYMFHVLRKRGISEVLVKDAIVRIYLNPHIWVYANYEVQRDLYMFLIQYFEADRRLLPELCGFPRIIDMISQFYWDKADSRVATGGKSNLCSTTKQVTGERPSREEVHKIRLLLLSLAEMSLRQKISPPDLKALIAFFEKSEDVVCIEDVLHMVIRALSQKQLLKSFLEQVNLLGGCHIFINLLHRELEPIRLLGLQFLGKLLVGLPSEKKGTKFFSLSVGRSKSLSESYRKGGNARAEPIFSAISERLFKFSLSDHLCATLFDVLLGGASPKQVLQKRSQSDKQKSKKNSSTSFPSHFFLPQILVCIFKFLSSCNESSTRAKVLRDLLNLLDSSPSNIEALMESAWNHWLITSVKLDVVGNYEVESKAEVESSKFSELTLVRNLYCVVLSHYIYSVKGGWLQLEETVNFLLLNFEQGELPNSSLVRDIFEDLIGSLLEVSSDDNVFISQPCRDNTLYLLKLIDELLNSEISDKPLFHGVGNSLDPSSTDLQKENPNDISSAVMEILNIDTSGQLSSSKAPWSCKTIPEGGDVGQDDWWNLYDKAWALVCEMNGKGSSKMLPKVSNLGGPSFGQRARGLVESLNIPAAEMAAVVVSGGIGNALGGKTNKPADKAMMLRGEKCQRIVFHLVILYICKGDLERASRCVQLLISLLPSLLTSEDDQSKNRLHFFIWCLLTVRSQYGILDDRARFHVISHLILETVNSAKSILAFSILGRDDPFESTNSTKETGFILNLIQKDRVVAAAVEEAKYLKSTKTDRVKQLQELRVKVDEYSSLELSQGRLFEDEIQSNMVVILSSDDSRKAAFQLTYDEDQQIIADKWTHMFRALIDERGPWSANPFPNNIVTRWKLDKTEDSWRRRQKLRRNYKFNEQLCYAPSTKSNNENNQPVSHTDLGCKSSEDMKRFLLKGVRGLADENCSESCEEANDLDILKELGSDNSSQKQGSDILKDVSDHVDVNQDRKDASTSTDSDSNEVHLTIPCVLVTPKRKLAGHLAIMQNALHFFGEFLVEGTGGSSVFNNFLDTIKLDSSKSDQAGVVQKQKLFKVPPNLDINRGKGNAANNTDTDDRLNKIKRHRRWIISKIKAVHWTRYLLQYTAIEIFYSDSVAPTFLNFTSPKDAKHIGTMIVSLRNESLFPKGISRDRSGIISFVDRRIAVEKAEAVRESWRRREISNFEYIMTLNTLAGRSYNDLTQYPVFPWVLADYSSEKLDFNKSSTFRDLSKPVGALDQKRFEVFEDRYCNFCDPDIPSFYYGSHYSSMGIVLYYLLRLEPFTALHRNLQGGKFDHADRLFQSLESTYRNCLSNTSDVKELIPEFFYMPEFLVNSNSYHLGVKQDGEPLGDVALPPWAKGSPEEFIQKNREALESEYVSSNLHHWIDLVFGYKQRGKPAVEAANVFYYLTYEGAVDLETMDDILQRSAIEDQIANFGQTPIQIFRKKHPRRGPPIPIAHPLYFAPASITLVSIISSTNSAPSAVLFLSVLDSNIVVVNQGLTLSVKMWLTTQLQSGGNLTFSGSQEPFFGIGSDVLPSRKIGTPLAENFEFGRQCLATMQTPNENYLLCCGSWENSFQIICLSDGRMVQSIRQHKDLVSCIAVSSDGSILATGSYDTTVMIWHSYRGRFMEKRSKNIQSELPRKDYVIIENPFHILCGHDDIITCLHISVELDIVISGSKDGTCIFHTLREGRYVRSIRHPSGYALSKLVVSQHGRLVLYAENDLSLHMYSINGKHIAASESNGRLNCMELSICGDFLVCAGDHGQIVLRSMHSLDVIRRYDGVGKIITSLSVTPEECFLAGTKDGSLLLYSIENPQLRRGNLSRNMKSKNSAAE